MHLSYVSAVVCLLIYLQKFHILAMTAKSNSVTSILDSIISKIEIEIELEQETASLYTNQSELENSVTSNKRSVLSSCDSIEDTNCRICYDPNQELPIIYPCKCKGTMGAIHLKCLERWLEESNRNSCELCAYEFQVERTPRYKVLRSIVVWLCRNQDEHQMYARNVKADLLRCLVVIPVTIACSYICVVAADFYAMNNYDNFPPARWTTYSLLSMMALLILSFFVWIYMALQYHQKAWFHWWQKSSIVTIVNLTRENAALEIRNEKRNISEI